MEAAKNRTLCNLLKLLPNQVCHKKVVKDSSRQIPLLYKNLGKNSSKVKKGWRRMKVKVSSSWPVTSSRFQFSQNLIGKKRYYAPAFFYLNVTCPNPDTHIIQLLLISKSAPVLPTKFPIFFHILTSNFLVVICKGYA